MARDPAKYSVNFHDLLAEDHVARAIVLKISELSVSDVDTVAVKVQKLCELLTSVSSVMSAQKADLFFSRQAKDRLKACKTVVMCATSETPSSIRPRHKRIWGPL